MNRFGPLRSRRKVAGFLPQEIEVEYQVQVDAIEDRQAETTELREQQGSVTI
jgi:hypothetical protein